MAPKAHRLVWQGPEPKRLLFRLHVDYISPDQVWLAICALFGDAVLHQRFCTKFPFDLISRVDNNPVIRESVHLTELVVSAIGRCICLEESEP